MRLSIVVLLFCIGCFIIPADNFDHSFEEEEEEEDEEEDDGRKRRFLPPMTQIFGVPEHCTVDGERHQCKLSFVCWMAGREPKDGCGSFLYRCCVPKSDDRRPSKTSSSSTRPAASIKPARPTPAAQLRPPRRPLRFLPTLGGLLFPSDNGVPAFNDPDCGVVRGPFLERFGAQRRIVGGDDAGFGHFPWQALVRIGSSRCGGSLVNHIYLVTAGHCVARAKTSQVQVTLGDYELKAEMEPFPSESYSVVDIQVHPRFQFTPQADRFDVAVLRLDRPVEYKPHISPICLPRKDENFEGAMGHVAGWGATEPGSKLRPNALQVVDVPIVSNGLCESWHKDQGIGVTIYPEMMCAGYRGGGKDSCQGDSGGPLMVTRFGVWYLVGLVSAGFSCAQQGQPGIYHRIAFTVDWIADHIN